MDSLENALRLSGDNRINLEQVLEHFKDNKLKLEAARFLIINMPYHYSMEEYYVSSIGVKYRPDITSHSGKAIKKLSDSLLDCGYRMERHKKFDITVIDSNFLINNIDLAFEVWKKT